MQSIRKLLKRDIYRLHTYAEMGGIVTPDVQARLEPGSAYGVYWFGERAETRRRVSENGEDGRVYRHCYTSRVRPWQIVSAFWSPTRASRKSRLTLRGFSSRFAAAPRTQEEGFGIFQLAFYAKRHETPLDVEYGTFGVVAGVSHLRLPPPPVADR